MFKREKTLLRRTNKVFRVLGQIEQHYRLVDPRTPEDIGRMAISTENRLGQLVEEGVLSFIPEFEVVVNRPLMETNNKTIAMSITAAVEINEMELIMAVLHWKDPKEGV